jgi:aspartate racemase
VPGHIGIVACSAEGAALCYRTICAEGPALLGAAHAHPEVTLHTPPLEAYVRALDAGDWDAVAALMLASADLLARAGADFLICPDNTLHAALPRVIPRSPRPWLHIAAVVAEEAVARGFRRIGVLGTRWLVDSDVYPEALGARGIACVRPVAAERDAVSRVIMDELVPARPTAAGTATLLEVIARFKAEERCDGVVLGCTELPLVIDDAVSALPTLDSTRLLARAALRRAVAPKAAGV